MDRKRTVIRLHRGAEIQTSDPVIAALTQNASAYRGTAYLVFEVLELGRFGNRTGTNRRDIPPRLRANYTKRKRALEGEAR